MTKSLLFSQRKKDFVKKYPQYKKAILQAGTAMSKAEPEVIECVELARREIGYSEDTTFTNIINALTKAYQKSN